jgi:hypothetical protein
MEEAARPRGRPRTGVTPKRNIRVGALWDEAQAIAASRGDSMTEVVKPAIERALRRYIRDNGGGAR